ncbi:hypothetical protein MPTK2_1g12270 [Marchantia polymorpha subsp. ruderalis]
MFSDPSPVDDDDDGERRSQKEWHILHFLIFWEWLIFFSERYCRLLCACVNSLRTGNDFQLYSTHETTTEHCTSAPLEALGNVGHAGLSLVRSNEWKIYVCIPPVSRLELGRNAS